MSDLSWLRFREVKSVSSYTIFEYLFFEAMDMCEVFNSNAALPSIVS